MVERWHQETSSFHLPVGEMTITLDDVACLLDIPVAGRIIQEEDLDHNHVVDLLLLGEYLSEEEEQEVSRIRPACVKAFLLLLVGYTLFANKNSKTISLLWMLAIRDLGNIGTWSWGAMGLAFLYEQLNLTLDSSVAQLVGWVITHFRHVVPRKKFEEYERHNPYGLAGFDGALSRHLEAVQAPTRRDAFSGRVLVLQMDHVDRQSMVCHLLERVLRQYEHVQRVPRPPTRVMPLATVDVAAAFLKFALHVVSQQQWGRQVPEDEPWKHLETYIRWFYRVSHPLIVNHAPEPDIVMPRPVYQDILVDQEWARHPPDPLQVINNMRGRVEHAMQIPEVVFNPLFFNILEGLQTDYSVFDDQQVPRRRSRSHSLQEQQQ
ncbi:protein MAIN-LIKE 2-like [Medicago truncatula]|uniref:protein MAIN-LIKE 2-like n=1 Tax=Medicago truncatula TaxID=3880 RepID=UPI0000D5E046|nr:protein MAIN-LIKE 2-like [Medicago truncatula]